MIISFFLFAIGFLFLGYVLGRIHEYNKTYKNEHTTV